MSSHSNGVCTDDRTSSASKNISNGDNSNGGGGGHAVNEATDDVKASQQHIRNLEMELKHAHEALAGITQLREIIDWFVLVRQPFFLFSTVDTAKNGGRLVRAPV